MAILYGIANLEEELDVHLILKRKMVLISYGCTRNPHTLVIQIIGILVHKFKLEVKQKMKIDFRSKYSVVYKATKMKFLSEIEDPEYRELVSFQLPSIVSPQSYITYITVCIEYFDNISIS